MVILISGHLSWSVQASIAKYNGLSGLQTTETWCSQLWRLEDRDQGAGRLSVWWGPQSWFTDGHLLAVSSRGGRHGGALWGAFYKDTIPFIRALLSWYNYLPKAPYPNIITLGLRFQHIHFGRHKPIVSGVSARRPPIRAVFSGLLCWNCYGLREPSVTLREVGPSRALWFSLAALPGVGRPPGVCSVLILGVYGLFT